MKFRGPPPSWVPAPVTPGIDEPMCPHTPVDSFISDSQPTLDETNLSDVVKRQYAIAFHPPFYFHVSYSCFNM